jgi:hypothetical protein
MKNYSFNKESDVKDLAYHLKKYFTQHGHDIKHSEILSGISHAIGFKNWNTYSSQLKNDSEQSLADSYDITQELLTKESAGGITAFILNHHFKPATTDYISSKHNAFNFLEGFVRALVFMRDNFGIPIDQQYLYNNMKLSSIISLSKKKELPWNITQSLEKYLLSLPEYNSLLNAKNQNQKTKDAHNIQYKQFISLNKNNKKSNSDIYQVMYFGTASDIFSLIKKSVVMNDPIWQTKIDALLITITEVLVYLRNNYNESITPDHFCDQLNLKNIIALQHSQKLPTYLQLKLTQYLSSLHGYSKNEPDDYYTRLGHIFKQKAIVLSIGYLTGIGDTYAYAKNIVL